MTISGIMGKYLIITLALILALTLPTMAKPENLKIGPYKVSFDMGIDNLKWVVAGPLKSETLGGSAYTMYNATSSVTSYQRHFGLVAIAVLEYDFSSGDGPGQLQIMKNDIESDLAAIGCTNIVVYGRIIDGHSAVIGQGLDATIGQIGYIAE